MISDMDSTLERFEEFLRTYKDEQGQTIYWSRLQQMPINDDTSLVIDYQDLIAFDNVFSVLAIDDPSTLMSTLSSALVSVLRLEDEDYVERVTPSRLKVRLINYSEHVALRAIRSRHIGRLIHISGILMRASEVKPLLEVGVFECRGNAGRCGNTIPVIQEEDRFTTPLVCDKCNTSKPPVKLLPEESVFIDWQKIRIQESPEELPPGQMPRSVDVTLKGDIVDVSRPGDLVKITGILRTSPDFSRRGGRLATFNVSIEANGVEISEKEYEQLEITEEDEKQIRELSEDPYVHERIYASIAPSIHGHEVIKTAIALLLFGGVGKTLPDGTRLRGRSNILMIGDPGTGKSQILKFVSGLAARALYTSGKGVSAAGLTAAVVHDSDTGAMTLEAGALVLADQGIACIDEFDKMDPNDRTAIHEAMEQHSFHPLTEILLANGKREPIGVLVDRLFEKHAEKVVSGVNCEIMDTSSMNFEVYTTDFKEVRKTVVDRMSRHPAPDYFFKIVFNNGRAIVVTPDHPLFVFRNSEVETIDAEDAKAGDFVPAPLKTACGHNPGAALATTTSVHTLAKQINTPPILTKELARILGYFVTEGYSYRGSSAEIGFSTTSKPIREDILSLMRNTFGIDGIDYTDKNRTVRFVSVNLMNFFERNFPEVMTLAPNKRAPRQVFISGEKALTNFLQSAFLGDGSVESEGLCYRTASRGLAHDYQDLLLGLGIQSRILVDSYNDSYKVYIRGSSLHLFNELIVEEWDSRMKDINRLVERSRKSNYSHDVFPPSFGEEMINLYKIIGLTYDGSFYRAIHEEFGITRVVLRKHLDIVKNAKIRAESNLRNPLLSLRDLRGILRWSQETAARRIGKRRSFIYHLENGGYSPDIKNKTMLELRLRIKEDLDTLNDGIRRLDDFLYGNIRSLRIKHVERIKNDGPFKAKYAYDVTVEPEHSFISQGTTLHNTVSIAKAGIVATLNARTSILAAANPTLGRYEPSLSVQDNIKLPFTILSRFDLIWILIDQPEDTKDRELAQFILGMHQMKKQEKKDTPAPIPAGFLKKYIGYANRYVIPQLTSEAAEVIENFYVNLRKKAEGGAAPVPITARQLESLVRLAEARAKMALRAKVTKRDAEEAVKLMEESLRMVALDPVTGKLDADRFMASMSSAQRSSSDIILKAMRDLEGEGSETMNKDTLIQRAVSMGLSADRAEEAIKKLEAEGILFYPREGKVKRIKS